MTEATLKRRKVSAIRDFPKGCRVLVPESPIVGSSTGAKIAIGASPGEDEVAMKMGGLELTMAKNGTSRFSELCSKRSALPKRREVSVVRDFPEGCVKIAPKAIVEEVSGAECSKKDDMMKSQAVEDGTKVVFSILQSKNVDAKELFVAKGLMIEADEVGMQGAKQFKSSDESKLKYSEPKTMGGDVNFNLLANHKNFGGEPIVESPKLNKLNGEDVVNLLERNNLDGEVMVKAPKSKNMEGGAIVKVSNPMFVVMKDMINTSEPKKMEGKTMMTSSRLEGKAMIKLPKAMHFDGEDTIKPPKSISVDVEPKTKSMSSKLKRPYFDVNSINLKNVDGKSMVKSPMSEDFDKEHSIKLHVLNDSEGEVMVKSPKSTNLGGDSRFTSPKSLNTEKRAITKQYVRKGGKKSLNTEKRAITKQYVRKGGKGVSSIKMEVETIDRKQEREKIPAVSNEDQVKSSVSNSLNEDIVDDRPEKNIMTRYTSDVNMDVSIVKEVGRNHPAEQESRDSSPLSESGVMDTVHKCLTGKLVSKSSVKGQMNNISLKRKLPDKADDETHIYDDEQSVEAYGNRLVVQALMSAESCPWRKGQKNSISLKSKLPGEADDSSLVLHDEQSVEGYGDRLVVQALMSAENCPWRKGKVPAGTRSLSAKSKFKAKGKQKLLTKSFASKQLSTAKRKHEDEEDEVDMVHQDDDGRKDLIVFKQSQELGATLLPCDPPQPDQGGANTEGASARSMVKKTLRLFQWITRKFLQEEEAGGRKYGMTNWIDLKASKILKENNQWVNYGSPILGNVPGVEVGDEFHYRVELSIIGIHRPFQGGIDYIKRDDMILATSIVASGGYPDDIDGSDVLIYSGSGWTKSGKDKHTGDQKLERGNLALVNSIDAKTPVRVVYGVKEQLKGGDYNGVKMVSTFSYDGLYIVERYWLENGANGYSVFKFQLRKMPGQPEIALKEVIKTKKSNVREGLISKDLSDGKETIPICVINTVDDEKPLPFKYITQVMYPSSFRKKPPKGCDCTKRCLHKCACEVKNGGEIPFNYNGAIVQAKTLVYECGPSCKCPASCPNRVSQRGIRIPLEVFKTEKRGWGVRSLFSIPSGSFVCEYIGEMLEDTEAEKRSYDEYLFDIGQNYDDHVLWEGLPNPISNLQSNDVCETVEGGRYTIDAAAHGNVGRFINHSCSPNLYAQNVLYDHDDKRIPHIMFFAADNIPPLQELTYHYNYSLDQVKDEDGNVQRKDCFCGSPECTGRLY